MFEQNVRRLQVSVPDALLVGVGQAVEDRKQLANGIFADAPPAVALTLVERLDLVGE